MLLDLFLMFSLAIILSNLAFILRVTEVILDSYTNASVKIVTLDGATDPIDIKRGVKQGCPLLPILFDNCTDPLIERLSSRGIMEYGYWGQILME
jgi:hypothetical protein